MGSVVERAQGLQSLKNFCGYKVCAQNGNIGQVEDFYFDDRIWATRYLVANCGNWVMGHQKVLVAPQHFERTDQTEGSIYLNLTREEVEASPELIAQTAVLRQQESALLFLSEHPDEASEKGTLAREDQYLCSLKNAQGLRIEARDGLIGHVSDFMVNDQTWQIAWMVVNTNNWLPGNFVLITPGQVGSVNWSSRKICLEMTRQEIRDSRG